MADRTDDKGCSFSTAEPLRELHLFAGAGGGILGGMLLGHTPVCAVEIDPYCRQVLRERIDDGTLPPFEIYDDVRTFDGRPWRGLVDVVAGGFPCQPFSCAGKQLGTADPRHLWPEMARIIEEVRPRYVYAENVSLAAFEEPWRDLRRMGYRVPPAICVSAADVGAPHLRKRWWLLATDADEQRGQISPARKLAAESLPGCDGEAEQVADAATTDADSTRLEKRQGQRSHTRAELETTIGADWWATEPDVGRVANGVAARVHRLKALGNGQVPQCAAQAWRILMELGI